MDIGGEEVPKIGAASPPHWIRGVPDPVEISAGYHAEFGLPGKNWPVAFRLSSSFITSCAAVMVVCFIKWLMQKNW